MSSSSAPRQLPSLSARVHDLHASPDDVRAEMERLDAMLQRGGIDAPR